MVCMFVNFLQLRYVSNKAMLIFALILLSPTIISISIQFIYDRPKLVTELFDIKVKSLALICIHS